MTDPIDELEFHELDVACTHCGARCSREVGQLRRSQAVACDACGREFGLDRDLLVCALHDLDADLRADEPEGPRPQRH